MDAPIMRVPTLRGMRLRKYLYNELMKMMVAEASKGNTNIP